MRHAIGAAAATDELRNKDTTRAQSHGGVIRKGGLFARKDWGRDSSSVVEHQEKRAKILHEEDTIKSLSQLHKSSVPTLPPHSIFINTETGTFWLLPQNQQIEPDHPILHQIQWNLNPVWGSVEEFDRTLAETKKWTDLNNVPFVPGARVLNASNFPMACVVSLLCNVRTVRDYFMIRGGSPTTEQSNTKILTTMRHPLAFQFSDTLRRIWNVKSFRSHLTISPLAKVIERESNGRFKVATGKDVYPLDVFNFLTHHMHTELTNAKLDSPFSCLQGKLKAKTSIYSTKGGQLLKEIKKSVPFRFLTCEVPFMTVYKDEHDRQIIPQVTLQSLLQKYDGHSETTRPSTIMPGNVERSTYEIRKLPEYVVLHLKRSSTSDASLLGKNRTIVTFPTRRFDLESILLGEKHPKRTGHTYNYVGGIIEDAEEEIQTLDRAKRGISRGMTYHVILHHEPTDEFLKCDSVACHTVGEESISVGNTILAIFRRA